MHIIVGLVLALTLLYFWLLAHWFARIIAFLLFAALFGLIGAMLTGMDGPQQTNHGWVGLLLGAAVAWPVSGVPLYVWRAKIRRQMEAANPTASLPPGEREPPWHATYAERLAFYQQDSARRAIAHNSRRTDPAPAPTRPQPEPPIYTPYKPEPDGLGWRAQIGAALLGQAIAAVIIAIAVAER